MTDDAPLTIEGVRQILEDYDSFLIDQWGVIHDGRSTYPHVAETLRLLVGSGATVVIATNSSKTSDRNVARLRDRFDIPPTSYSWMLSSAQLLQDHLLGDAHGIRRAVVVADAGDEVLLEPTAVVSTDELDEADAVIMLSVDPQAPTRPLRELLAAAAERGLPLLMPSCDHNTVTVAGVHPGMGQIIDESFLGSGGRLRNFGKPEREFYEAFRGIAALRDTSRVLVIGDQVGSDVLGGAREGYDSLLVATGAGREAVALLAADRDVPWAPGIRPTYLLDQLRP